MGGFHTTPIQQEPLEYYQACVRESSVLSPAQLKLGHELFFRQVVERLLRHMNLTSAIVHLAKPAKAGERLIVALTGGTRLAVTAPRGHQLQEAIPPGSAPPAAHIASGSGIIRAWQMIHVRT